MSNLTKITIAQAQTGLKNKDFTAVELLEAHLKRMEETRDLNAFVTETPDLALSAARTADARIQQDQMRPLEGIPIAIKDLFCTRGVKTTAGSRILGNFTPPYESTVTKNLWDGGAVMLGKTSLDEFAMGSSNLTSAFGPVKNPWKATNSDEDLVPGGSSGGSVAAVSSFSAMGATGTDTGGSIRQPAAFCGVTGLKPTYGRCSRFGIVSFASSLDQAGPVARTIEDAALLFKAMASHDPKDSTSSSKPLPDLDAALTGDVSGLKVGIPKEYRVEGMNGEVTALWEKAAGQLRQEGAEIIDVSLPHTRYALPTYYIIAPAEASSNLSRYDGVRYGHRIEGETLDEMYEATRSAGFGEEVKRRIMIGTYVLSAGYYDAYYLRALKVRRLIQQDFIKAFEKVDVLLTPTTPAPAFSLENPPTDPITMYMNDVLTVPASLAGIPALSLPAALTKEGLPLGLQLIGPAFREDVILKAGKFLETAADFSNQTVLARKAS
ncbi:MAG: Asp-tRNA(Asn)/Glu-tRNA(Gln) amidotransferase subunit GatA [bacterium]|nr:Asp-tRNA(Asn)/Glu-tRNA(Gln) amidotransferase subunit GatA [bacterium]